MCMGSLLAGNEAGDAIAAGDDVGSPGWCQCYWCDYWVHDPYLPDGFPWPLCEWCNDWLEDGGGPWEPCARTRAAHLIQRWFPALAPDTCSAIACFAVPWGEP